MSEYYATVAWNRNGQEFSDNRYSREHTWSFDGGFTVPASPSPHVVPAPMSVAANVDPEEAYVASLSSCHMLFFLSFAVKDGFIVDAYTDRAVGVMARNEDGRMAMILVTLHPVVAYSGAIPSLQEEQALHHRAHESCFIANSVKTEIMVSIAPR